jgi:hypothetical protein
MNNITDSAYISTLTILHNIRFQIVYHLNGSEMNTNFLILITWTYRRGQNRNLFLSYHLRWVICLINDHQVHMKILIRLKKDKKEEKQNVIIRWRIGWKLAFIPLNGNNNYGHMVTARLCKPDAGKVMAHQISWLKHV